MMFHSLPECGFGFRGEIRNPRELSLSQCDIHCFLHGLGSYYHTGRILFIQSTYIIGNDIILRMCFENIGKKICAPNQCYIHCFCIASVHLVRFCWCKAYSSLQVVLQMYSEKIGKMNQVLASHYCISSSLINACRTPNSSNSSKQCPDRLYTKTWVQLACSSLSVYEMNETPYCQI